MQKFWYLETNKKKASSLYSHTKGKWDSTCWLFFPACTSLRLMSEQSGGWRGERERERNTTISPLGKAQLTEPSCFLLAVDSAETTAAEFIMVIFKGPTDRIARPTCHTHSLAAPALFPQLPFYILLMHFQGERGSPFFNEPFGLLIV